MSGHADREDQLVEPPAIGLFAELGWTTGSALEEILSLRWTRLLSGQVALASVSANGAFLCQPGAAPQVFARKFQEG
jgi:type I restriction enzyme R subunit